MNQDPAAGIMVKKDADVELLVNGGVGQVEVPDVVTDHMTLEEAQQAIEDAGLHSQVENVADDEVEEGRVISTNPEPGTMVDSGSTVTLRVSTGPAEEMVTVPDGLVATPWPMCLPSWKRPAWWWATSTGTTPAP